MTKMICNKRDIYFKLSIVLVQNPTFQKFLSSSSDRNGKGEPTPVGYLERAYIYIYIHTYFTRIETTCF